MPQWLEYEQGSDDWSAARVGVLTASRAHDALSRLKSGKPAESSRKMLIEIVTERLTGLPTPVYTNTAMIWGIENEPLARRAYEMATGRMVDIVGLAYHDTIPGLGASPDGLVGNDGLIEIKCPNSATHVECLITGEIPERYQTQMLAQMSVTGRAWCDFVSYDPRLPQRHNLFIKRFHCDAGMIADFEEKASSFLESVIGTILRMEGATNGI